MTIIVVGNELSSANLSHVLLGHIKSFLLLLLLTIISNLFDFYVRCFISILLVQVEQFDPQDKNLEQHFDPQQEARILHLYLNRSYRQTNKVTLRIRFNLQNSASFIRVLRKPNPYSRLRERHA